MLSRVILVPVSDKTKAVKGSRQALRLTCGINDGIQQRPEGRRGTMRQEVCEEEPVAERGQGLRGPAFGDMSFPFTSTRCRLRCGLGT